MPKARINISLDQDLADFVKMFAEKNRTSVADVVTQYFLALKRKVEGKETDTILSDPAFRAAMEEMLRRLRSGRAVWHSYKEVFGE